MLDRMIGELDIFCADIGSVKAGRFGWSARTADGESSGTDIEALCTAVVESLNAQRPVALGFECPVFVPVRLNPMDLTKARSGEGSRPWSAGAGTGAMATGLVQVTWMLGKILELMQDQPAVWMDWSSFRQAGQGLLLWEAFVVDKSKGHSHCDDAKIAVDAFARCLPDPSKHNLVVEPSVLSLLGAALLRSGWCVDPSVLAEPCLVIAGDAGY